MRAHPDPVGIAILAKAPIPGLAKTRLIPALGAAGAAALQARLIVRTVATACAAATGPVSLWATPDATHPVFRDMTARFRLSVARQPDGDLGTRMLAAIAAAAPTLVIGTDCPVLTAGHLVDAATALRDGVDAVVIPAEDGGYVLIGLRRPEPAVFADMTWSTNTVMAETRARLTRLGLGWRELAPLWDVDRPEDLARMAAVERTHDDSARSG
jgi:rSAM/selenodomain-associated transferase 1